MDRATTAENRSYETDFICRATAGSTVGALAAVLLMSGTAIASPTCTIRGSHRGETLNGGPGRDVICGRGGNDTLRGLGGDDILLGGEGDDVLDGGAGADVFGAGGGEEVARARDGRRDWQIRCG